MAVLYFNLAEAAEDGQIGVGLNKLSIEESRYLRRAVKAANEQATIVEKVSKIIATKCDRIRDNAENAACEKSVTDHNWPTMSEDLQMST